MPTIPKRLWPVAVLVSKGRTDKEIAVECGLTSGTVKQYVLGIRRILHLRNRVELAVWVCRQQVAQ